VRILNGTFSKWKNENRKTEKDEQKDSWKRLRSTTAGPDDFAYKLDKSKVVDYEQIVKIGEANEKKSIDQ